jgi:hypothetical protein
MRRLKVCFLSEGSVAAQAIAFKTAAQSIGAESRRYRHCHRWAVRLVHLADSDLSCQYVLPERLSDDIRVVSMLTTQRLSCFSWCSCSGVSNDTDAVVFTSAPIHFPVPCNIITQLVGPIVVPLLLQTLPFSMTKM